MQIDWQRFRASLRGTLLLSFCIFAVTATISHFILPLLGHEPPVKNSEENAGIWLVFLWGSACFLLLMVPRPAMVLAVSLMAGGATSNVLDRKLFGPVADYLPLPWSGGIYFNLPDMLIAIGPVFLLLYFLLKQQDLYVSLTNPKVASG